MNSSKYGFTLDLHTTQSQVSIPAAVGDLNRTLYISLSDGGQLYHIADGCTASLNIKRPGGTIFTEYCIIEGNSVIKYPFSANPNTCAEPGIHDCQIILIDAEEKPLGTPRFTMVVSERVISSDDYVVTDEDRTLIDAIEAQEAARQAAETQRVTNEGLRSDAEGIRQGYENVRQMNETQRQNKETERQSNEADRASWEASRRSSEESRRTSEIDRQYAEEAREEAEAARQEAEAARQEAVFWNEDGSIGLKQVGGGTLATGVKTLEFGDYDGFGVRGSDAFFKLYKDTSGRACLIPSVHGGQNLGQSTQRFNEMHANKFVGTAYSAYRVQPASGQIKTFSKIDGDYYVFPALTSKRIYLVSFDLNGLRASGVFTTSTLVAQNDIDYVSLPTISKQFLAEIEYNSSQTQVRIFEKAPSASTYTVANAVSTSTITFYEIGSI